MSRIQFSDDFFLSFIYNKGSVSQEKGPSIYQVIATDSETKIRSGLANLFPWNQLGSEITGLFSNGRDAYDLVLSNPVDPVLSGIHTPLMDGLEPSERLLSHKKTKIIPFSSYQDFDYVRKALRNGVLGYLLEPVKYEDLADCLTWIKELLGSERDQDISEVCESLSYYEKIISAVKGYPNTGYQDATLEQAARLMSLGPNYLSKIMKKHSDISFSNYSLKTRIEDAVRMLRDTGYEQYGIVYRIDYDNPKSFSRTFHQHFNMTPTQYRNYGGRPEPQL